MHDIEDWSNDAENSAFHNMNYIKKKKKIENVILNYNHIINVYLSKTQPWFA